MGLETTLDRLAKAGSEKAIDKVEEGKWFDSLVEKGRGQLDKIKNSEIRDETSEAVDGLVKLKPLVVNLSAGSLTSIVGHLAIGEDGDARQVYLEHLAQRASLDELFAASKVSTDKIVGDKAQELRNEENWKKLAQGLGEIALRLLPLLLRFV